MSAAASRRSALPGVVPPISIESFPHRACRREGGWHPAGIRSYGGSLCSRAGTSFRCLEADDAPPVSIMWTRVLSGAVLAEERGWRELPVPAIGQDGVQAPGPDLTARLGDLTNLLAISSG